MTKIPANPDITVRGGTVNVPHSTESPARSRYHPNTPPNKKRTKHRPDHIIPESHTHTTPDQPPATTADPPAPPEPEPEPASKE